MRLPFTTRRSRDNRNGATLLVTLGILTVLSVLVVAYLVSSRLHRQTVIIDQNRLAARNFMDAGLHLAMRQIEDAFTYPNYTDDSIHTGEFLTPQRLAPINQWFAKHYDETNSLSRKVSYQAPDVLASPTFTNAPTVNLLTPQVLRMVPSALTNGLALSPHSTRPLRSGWIPLEPLPASVPLEMRLKSKPARIAFAVFNCSGFVDANTFLSGPTMQKLPRMYFSQADVTNWVESTEVQKRLQDLDLTHDPENTPFFHLSYDPDPNIYPLHYDCFEICTSLGRNSFGGPVLDLNIPQAYRAMGSIKEQATYWRFNLNTLTNHINRAGPLSETPWYNDSDFKLGWFSPVTGLLDMMKNEEPVSTRCRWHESDAIAWAMANFMDEDRIPQISTFSADENGNQQLPTRANFAVEDVPLINKVTVFNIFDDPPKGYDPDYYEVDSNLSNIYAVAVELWYPFTPNLPLDDSACYVGIYTNAMDVQTTTNRPWSNNLLRDWLRWNYDETSNTVMQTFFYAWGSEYLNAVGPSIWSHPLWQTVNTDSELWFTTAMTNHVYWPVAETNGTYDITANPIWQAFYPETYQEVVTNVYDAGTTNQLTVVSTNEYTTLVATNTVLDWFVPPDTTNRFISAFEGETPADYPWIIWSDTTASTFSTNRITGFDLSDSTQIRLSESNLLTHFYFQDNAVWVVVTNTVDGTVTANSVSNLYLLGPSSTNQVIAPATDFTFSDEITRVQPLPMPDDLGTTLDGLMNLLPTNSVSSLYTFLMATPYDLNPADWDRLFINLTQIPGVFDQIFPSNGEPTLGNMTEKDRHILWPEDTKDEVVILDKNYQEKITAQKFQGYFWTVYPKQTVSFMEATKEVTDNQGKITQPASTNYHALGKTMPGHSTPNTIWIRPAVTIRQETKNSATGQTGIEDVIVDEALLTHDNDNAVPVWGWTAVTNLCIPDPRKNAYARDWRAFPDGKRWDDLDVLNTTNLNTDVHELPFIHFDSPFTTIGDIGHIYADYERSDKPLANRQREYDTLTFSTRSGAALLDIFTITPTNGPKRGLIQANSQHSPVIKTLLTDVRIGWTNAIGSSGQELLNRESKKSWTEVYSDALTNAPYSMGWRSFADMLPSLSTNETLKTENVWAGAALHPMHDYTEDVLRGLVDKVSFRQNVFVIIVAAQALSPASTPNRPVVLADQRAAVTVLRDAYTGRWTVHDWTWLTE